jgi:hypothetical protein
MRCTKDDDDSANARRDALEGLAEEIVSELSDDGIAIALKALHQVHAQDRAPMSVETRNQIEQMEASPPQEETSMFMQSENVNEIVTALAKAQLAMEPASKDSVNPAFKSRYADLSSITESCRKPLAENGIARVQTCVTTDGGVEVTTRLFHSSGQWIGMTITMPVEKRTTQAVGNAMTYGRRYGLACLVGIVADVDDDGNATSGVDASQTHQAPRQSGPPARQPAQSTPATTAAPEPNTTIDNWMSRLLARDDLKHVLDLRDQALAAIKPFSRDGTALGVEAVKTADAQDALREVYNRAMATTVPTTVA